MLLTCARISATEIAAADMVAMQDEIRLKNNNTRAIVI